MKKDKGMKQYYPIHKAKNIVLIFNLQETSLKDIKYIENQLKEQDANVFVIEYDEMSSQSVSEPNMVRYGRKQCNLFLRPKGEIAQNIKSQQPDIWIDLTIEQCKPITKLLSSLKKGYIYGVDKNDGFEHDFSIRKLMLSPSAKSIFKALCAYSLKLESK